MRRTAAGDLNDIADGRFDFTQLGRVALWASLAVLTTLAAVFAARSETGTQRIAAAMSGQPDATRTAAAGRLESANTALQASEVRRLADSVRLLAADRDRLLKRLEALERGLDTTGSIGPGSTPPTGERPASPVPPPATGEPLTASPPANGRSSGNAQPAQREAGQEATVTRTEFGLDLGAAPSLEALRALWSTIRTQHGAALEGLRPVVRIRENPQSGVPELRLIAGPLGNAAAAARLCAVISASGRGCQPTTFEGQRLAAR